MSLEAETTRTPRQYAQPPPPFPSSTMDDPRTFHSLPPMSELLRHEEGTHDAQRPLMARQFHTSFNMVKQPLWMSTVDPNVPPAQRAYHPSQPQINSHILKDSSDSVPNAQNPPQRTLSVPSYRNISSQSRIEKRISQRRDQLKDQSQGRRGSAESPVGFREDPRGLSLVATKDPYDRPSPGPYGGSPRPMAPSQSSRSMPISGLLSDAPRYEHKIDSRTHLSCTDHYDSERPEPKYILKMRQQPIAARACGFGERDRRVIDPPPILQMYVEDPNASPEEIRNLVRQPWAVVHCVLWDPIANRDDTAMPGATDKRQQRRLMGTLVSSPFVGNDEHGVEGCFFAFPDLSVRTPGTYSLKFSLVLLNPARMFVGSKEKVKSVVFSSTFHVYNAKDFCGMRASSALTKSLKLQGCLISVKKGNAGKNSGSRGRDEADDDDDEEDEEDEGASNRRTKRAKR